MRGIIKDGETTNGNTERDSNCQGNNDPQKYSFKTW